MRIGIRLLALNAIFACTLHADSREQPNALTTAASVAVGQAIRSEASARSITEIASVAIVNAHASLADSLTRLRIAREAGEADIMKRAQMEFRVVSRSVAEADAEMRRIQAWLGESGDLLAEAEEAAAAAGAAVSIRAAERAVAKVSKRAESIEGLVSRIRKSTQVLKQTWLIVRPTAPKPSDVTATTSRVPALKDN